MLVFIDTFSGWVEAFPTKNETALVVAKKIIIKKNLPKIRSPSDYRIRQWACLCGTDYSRPLKSFKY